MAPDTGIVLMTDDIWFDPNAARPILPPPYPEAEQAKRRSNGQAHPGGDIRFRFKQFREIQPSTAPAYVVDKIIPRLGVVVIWGKPKCGKTFWTFDLEMHVALGWPYRGHHVEQGEVLHIACEGVAGLGSRKEAWRLHHIVEKTGTEIQAIDNAPFHLCRDSALDLIKDVDTVVDDILAQFGDRPIKIITIDTLNRSLRGSESKDDDMAAYVRAATLLAEKFQCVVTIIHHCGHNEDRPRGHSSLLGAVDALIEIKKDGAGRVLSEVEEMRDGPTGETTVSRLEVIDVTYTVNGEMITSCVIVPTTDTPSSDHQAIRRLSAKDQIALDALHKAIDEAGETAPATPHIPENVRGASLDMWRRYCLLGSASDERSQDARWKAFQRSRDNLQAKHAVCIWGDFVWAV
jgi:hypothetical protein